LIWGRKKHVNIKLDAEGIPFWLYFYGKVLLKTYIVEFFLKHHLHVSNIFKTIIILKRKTGRGTLRLTLGNSSDTVTVSG
jgi:hypothetical protein